jgi:hypothetical protein
MILVLEILDHQLVMANFGDGVVNCKDIAIVKASFGKKRGQTGFDARADMNNDGIADVRDLAIVSRQLPTGTRCP